MTSTELIINCLKESGPLTLEALIFESELDESTILASLLRLNHEGRLRCNDGVFAYFNESHSKKVKRGILISKIPSLG